MISSIIEVYLIYLRKSRKDGEEDISDVLSRHYTILQEWAKRTLGHEIPERDIYREVVSGETITERIQLQKLLKRCEEENIKGVIVIEPQRLTRGDYGDIDRIVKTFQYSNTLIYTPTYTYNLSDKRDKKSFEMDLLRGADYLDYIKEILMRGRKLSASEGKFVGSVAAWGYDKVKLHKGYTLKPNADAEGVKIVFDMYSKGIGLWTIAARLNALGYKPKRGGVFKDYNIRQMLDSEVYIGLICFDKRIQKTQMVNGKVTKKIIDNPNPTFYKGMHPAIIDEEVFYKVQAKRKQNSAKCVNKNSELMNPLSGIIRCKFHDIPLKRKGGNGGMTSICKYTGCNNIFGYMEDIEKALIDQMKIDLQNYKLILDNYADVSVQMQADNSAQIDRLNKQIDKYRKGILTAQRRYNDEEYTNEEYISLKNDYLHDISLCEAEKDKLLNELRDDNTRQISRLVPNIEKCIDRYFTLSNKDKNKFLKSIILVAHYSKTEKGRDKPITIDIQYLI